MKQRELLSNCSNSQQDIPGRPIWTKDPFTSQGITTMLLSSSTDYGHNDAEQVPSEFNLAESARCPKDLMPLEYVPKARPTPIYHDKQHEEYWSFLKSVPDMSSAGPALPTRCPSLASGGTLSSRNSSTRSTRSSIWESIDDWTNGMKSANAIYEGSILPSKDDITHRRRACFKEQLAETCPVKTCERHLRGFTRAGDRIRHTFTHFEGTLQCNFCKSDTTSFSQSSDRVTLFLTHLVKHHDVRGQQLDRDFIVGKSSACNRKSTAGGPVATCSVCSEPFTAQILYEHLAGCILRNVSRSARSKPEDTDEVAPTIDSDLPESSEPDNIGVHYTLNEVERKRSPEGTRQIIPLEMPVRSVELEHDDVAELTASSRCLSLTSSRAIDSSEEETDWTDDIASRESSPGVSQLPQRLTPAKRRVVDTVMQEFHRLLDRALRAHTASGSSSSSSHGGYNGWSSNASTYSSNSFGSRKRSLSGGGSNPPDDDEDSNKRRRPNWKGDGKHPVGEPRFACPYYKRNPGRHQTFTSCRDPGFTTVARLKEHLYRRHLLPPQCHRCCTTFSNDTLLREHQRDPRGCAVHEQIPLEGFDKDQERKLKSKKRSQIYQSEEDKWKGVYRILFPDDADADMPDPHIEYLPCNSDNNPTSNIQCFQEFSRLELPRLVRRTLEVVVEQESQPLEDKLKERLVDIVQECQTRLFDMFQSTATAVPTRSDDTAVPLGDAVEGSAGESSGSGSNPLPVSLFHDFDGLPVRTSGAKDMLSVPQDATACVEDSTPDSGYEVAGTQFPAATLGLQFEGDIARGRPQDFGTGGYEGLFGGADVLGLSALTATESTWPFIDPWPETSEMHDGGAGWALQ